MNDVELSPVGVHARYWRHSVVEVHKALRRGDPLEDPAGRAHRKSAANGKGTSAAIRVFHNQDRQT